ncbi:I78 family peptidase inhibitor [Sphingomonas sp.]|uniref:I78 family peptidase inhibitor n=1 Tax=Sphingomonas sp. TaxID=28214 RepID=UPI001EC6464E|nr:I78 family peptidase inhibitor [Sphingomonas sp.]MBX3595151.1 hypothetical protein [Sphingomonas sp.]
MIRPLALSLPLILAACAPMPGREAGVLCNADRVQPMVGRPYTDEMGARAKERSGARSLRVIRPGQAVTMDFRSDRLNLDLDNVDTIKAARCG